MARPRRVITADHLRQIETLAGYGLTEAAIAHVIGVSPDTFRRRKADEDAVLRALEKGKADAEQRIGEALFVKAVKGDLGAIVWWEKTRAGRSDRVTQEITGKDGGPVTVVNVAEVRGRLADRLAGLAARN